MQRYRDQIMTQTTITGSHQSDSANEKPSSNPSSVRFSISEVILPHHFDRRFTILENFSSDGADKFTFELRRFYTYVFL